MPVSRADIDEVLALEGKVADDPGLACLQSIEEVIAFAVALARAAALTGYDEADVAEIIVRGADLSPDRVREAERTLRRLGYLLVADRLRAIAGRRKRGEAPPPRWPPIFDPSNQAQVKRQAEAERAVLERLYRHRRPTAPLP